MTTTSTKSVFITTTSTKSVPRSSTKTVPASSTSSSNNNNYNNNNNNNYNNNNNNNNYNNNSSGSQNADYYLSCGSQDWDCKNQKSTECYNAVGQCWSESYDASLSQKCEAISAICSKIWS